MSLRIVKTGKWLYGMSVYLPVDIVAINYDFWYQLDKADGQLELNDQPEPLNAEGVLYYVRFRKALEPLEPTWPDSSGYTDINEAMAYAQSKVPGSIHWDSSLTGRGDR